MIALRACYGLVIAALAAVAMLACAAPRPTAELATAELATCSPNAALACTTLDGVPLGPFWTSVSLDTAPCDRCHDLPGTARSALDHLAPNHPPLTSIDEFGPDPRALCGTTPCVTSSGLGIFVFTFSDATTMPIVVLCVGVSECERVDHYGPPY